MAGLLHTIPHTPPTRAHRPPPRVIVDAPAWTGVARDLAAGRLTLVSLWADPGAVHLALLSEQGEIAVVTHECSGRRYPSVGALHPPAIRLERAIRDLYGLEPE